MNESQQQERGLFTFLERLFNSGVKYVKSSILSIIIIAVMFFLLTKMEQGAAMVVDLAEDDWFAFLMSVVFVNALAFTLSHFPIYNYYAANLNNNKDVFSWRESYIFRWIKVSVFSLQKDKRKYKYNLWANIFRYLNGFLVYAAWNYIVIFGFERNLMFEGVNVTLLQWGTLLIALFLYVIYGIIKRTQNKLKEGYADLKFKHKSSIESPRERLDKLNVGLGWSLLVLVFLMLISLLWTVAIIHGESSAFSKFGLLLFLVVNIFCLAIYFNFRLIRPQFESILQQIKSKERSFILRWFIRGIKFLGKPENYIGLLFVFFILSLIFILYSHGATMLDWNLPNGIPILFAYLYFFSYGIATIFKFYFVTHKSLEDHFETPFNRKKKLFKRRCWGVVITILVGLIIIGTKTETELHQLSEVSKDKELKTLSDYDLSKIVRNKEESVMFFVAAQGGGLKANFWTLNVLNHLQSRTGGEFLDQTVAMSGASGGSLALGLYTALYKEFGKDTVAIQSAVDEIVKQNYTAMDLTLMFGWDFLRSAWPLNNYSGNKNRTYYSMVKYQNTITGGNKIELSDLSYRALWKDAYEKEDYYPSLIMNTASTDGNRGIFWSHTTNQFDRIFPYAKNLADIDDNTTVPFYQAISTTNRFPLFSPAAKIKGYGHFIDAGAIDNSGLMGCLDLYRHLEKDSAFVNKKIVFVEIVNSKSKYIRHLLRKFCDESKKNKRLFIDEDETSTASADLQSGLNLDKIPEYLSDYMRNWEKGDPMIEYVEIMLPHRISLEDVESILGGEICVKNDIRSQLVDFLETENKDIRSFTERPKGFVEPWKYFEPTLSRHLSRSNIAFGKAAFKQKLLSQHLEEIRNYTKE